MSWRESARSARHRAVMHLDYLTRCLSRSRVGLGKVELTRTNTLCLLCRVSDPQESLE